MRIPQRLFHLPPRILGWAVLVLAVAFSFGAQTYSILRVAEAQTSIAALVRADHTTIEYRTTLLKRIVLDEERACAAGKLSGDQAIITLVCHAPFAVLPAQ